MVNERLNADMLTMLDGLNAQMRGIAELQLKRSKLTATADACEQRITVKVNAAGLLIETKFADDIAELTYDEIAEGMTAAVQQAAAEVMRRGKELMEPLRTERTRLPKLSDIIEGAPDLGSLMPKTPPTPTNRRDIDAVDVGESDGSRRSMISDDD